MAYNKSDLEQQALDAIKKHDLVFISEVVSYLPCAKSTFFSKKLDESDSIKEALENNKIEQKKTLRGKWRDSENATVQIALYRLLSDDDENDKLNGGKQRHEHDHNVKGELNLHHSAEKKFFDDLQKMNNGGTGETNTD